MTAPRSDKEPLARMANAEDGVKAISGTATTSRSRSSMKRPCSPPVPTSNVSAQVRSMLERLGTTAEVWKATLLCLFSKERPLGVAFAFSRKRLAEAAARRGCHHLANLNGCPA